jgi:uncharacterized protein YaeQ
MIHHVIGGLIRECAPGGSPVVRVHFGVRGTDTAPCHWTRLRGRTGCATYSLRLPNHRAHPLRANASVALKSTIFKATLQIADIDHGCYLDQTLTLARHPSETDERMMVRLVALALNAHQVQDLCRGDGTIGFGAGLGAPDDPDVLLTDYTGRKRLWVEVGQPDEKPLARACSQADAVIVYAFAPAAEVWWRGIAGRVARLPRLAVWRLAAADTQALGALAERQMRLTATVQEGAITIAGERGAVHLEPQGWKAPQDPGRA